MDEKDWWYGWDEGEPRPEPLEKPVAWNEERALLLKEHGYHWEKIDGQWMVLDGGNSCYRWEAALAKREGRWGEHAVFPRADGSGG